MVIKIKKVDGLVLPKQAHADDAAFDVFATTDPKIVGKEVGGGIYSDIQYIEYGTNLYIAPQSEKDIRTIKETCHGEIMGHYYKYTNTEPIDKKYFVELRPRSSISKYNLSMCNNPATIDLLYRGEVKVRFRYHFQPNDLTLSSISEQYNPIVLGARVNMDRIYKKGDAICQLRAVEQYETEFVLIDELDKTERAEGGFGSSGNNSAK